MKKILLIISMTFLVFSGSSFAVDSNKEKVKRSVMKDWDRTAWGVIIGDAEYARFMAAVAQAVASENPQPVIKYFERMARRNIEKFGKEAGDIGKDVLWDAILSGLKRNGKVTRLKKVDLKAGLATWQRWKRVVYHEPRTYKCKKKLPFGGWTWGVCSKMVKKERKVPLPNWHMPYVSIRYK